MATATQADYTVTTSWTNLVATIGAAGSVDVLLQNKGDGDVRVYWGGAEPTDEDGGVVLETFDSMQGNAAAIWVRTDRGTDPLGVTLL